MTAIKVKLGLNAASAKESKTFLDVDNPSNKHYHKDAKAQMIETIERFRNRAEVKKVN